MTLDLSKEQGREVLVDIVRWADVVCESFSPKAMPAWGLDYESLRQAKPDIIMMSTCLMGQSGPLSQFAGFGSLAAAYAGFYEITGWPDRPPAGPFGAYTDTIVPRFMAAAILAALDHRRRTGEGQYIDQSQAESALHFLGPALLDATVNGRVQGRIGNRDPQMAPHGVYRAAGDDRWVAIAVADGQQWAALCDVIEQPELASDERLSTAAGRLAHQGELDAAIAGWTESRDAHEAERALQQRGVPASAVQDSSDLYADPQLAHRGHFADVEHATLGKIAVEGTHFRLSKTPARLERAAPAYGQDNQHILETILGYESERIAELAAQGILE